MEIKKVGVVGCGTMGGGIAEVCARAGYATVVSEINQQLLDKGMAGIRNSLSRAVEKGKATAEERDKTLARLKGTVRMEDFAGCDLVIEAAIENMAEKKKIFAALDKVCPKDAILASNTSCLSVLDMAMATGRPDKVLGIHFFNPVPLMKLVELVKTMATGEETLGAAQKFVASLGKESIVARDSPGFIVNRLIIPYVLDAIRMLESGLASKEDIDRGTVLGLSHPIGPLSLCDLIGLDVVHFIASAMYDEFKEPRFASPVLLKKMVTAGKLGRKTGQGFYQYGGK